MSRATSSRPPLARESLGSDPIAVFRDWLETAAEGAGVNYPNAMVLATTRVDGGPDARVVLLKGVDERGFLFFTNFRSVKGAQLEHEPRAALVFHWDALGRQIRVRGEVERLGSEESDAYFRTRPRGSQLGAWASDQSREIDGRNGLEARFAEVSGRFDEGEVPRPPHWGGFLLRPREIEFWQDRPDRLHDRFLFRREGERWEIARLSP